MKTEEHYFNRADVMEFWAFRKYLRESNLSTSARLLAVDVWFHMQIGKLRANPSLATLIENTGMSERTVRRSMSEIKSCGFFKVTGGRGKKQTYNFVMVAPEKTLFELSELLAEKPKTTQAKAAKLAPYNTPKGANLAAKGANLAPEYNLEYKTTTTAEEILNDRFAERSLRSALIDAAGCAIINPAQCSDLASMASPRAWLDAGCDLERDILPVIRGLAARKTPGSIRTWGYFEEAVLAEKARRERPVLAAPFTDNVKPHSPATVDAFVALAKELVDRQDHARTEGRPVPKLFELNPHPPGSWEFRMLECRLREESDRRCNERSRAAFRRELEVACA